MKTKLTMIGTLAAIWCLCVFSYPPNGGAGQNGRSVTNEKVEEIRRTHKSMCDISRSSIMAGYTACRLGIPLTNYLADVEKAWDKLLKEKIAEATKQ